MKETWVDELSDDIKAQTGSDEMIKEIRKYYQEEAEESQKWAIEHR